MPSCKKPGPVVYLLGLCLWLAGCGGGAPRPQSYTVSVTVTNLASNSGGLMLKDNLTDTLAINANGAFTFATALPGNGRYSVTVSTQPSNPPQTCGVTNGSGIIFGDVTNVQVDCSHNEWTWEGGSMNTEQKSVYGALGEASAANFPGARQLPVTWTDASGNLWLFGGYGTDSTGARLLLNDLWEYSNGQWTWVGGSQFGSQKGVYGSLGTPSPSNFPGGRYEAASWVDASGNLWLFGGSGYDSAGTEADLNDLWEYGKGEWTWMGGSDLASQLPSYGTMGIASSTNMPGPRFEAVTWVDQSGDFWLFGGFGRDSTGTIGLLNDLWKYSAGQWTWVSGPKLTNGSAVFGTRSVPAPGNIPGSRYSATSWVDLSGNLWLFGGTGYTTGSSNGMLDDLWKFSNGQWAWMGGSSNTYQIGVYGARGTPSAANIPSARQNALGWTDASGSFWLFGGNCVYSSALAGLCNDIWKYESGQWTWMAGSNQINQPGGYGTLGAPEPDTVPGARTNFSGWIDAKGNLLLFGGYGVVGNTEGDLNDLWKYYP